MVRAWYMDDSTDDKRLPHLTNPPRYVDLDALKKIGVLYFEVNADGFPEIPKLKKIREDRGYNYEDHIEIHKDKLPNYDEKNYIKAARYFVGEPVWTPHDRPADDMDIRKKYVSSLS